MGAAVRGPQLPHVDLLQLTWVLQRPGSGQVCEGGGTRQRRSQVSHFLERVEMFWE